MQPLSKSFATALLALAELAGQGRTGVRVQVNELSTRTGLPAPYLGKVMQQLARAGLVDGKRGYQGGYRLALAPSEIDLLSLAFEVDPQVAERSCLLGTAACDDEHSCPLHEFWKSTRERIERELASTTIADAAAFEREARRQESRQVDRQQATTQSPPTGRKSPSGGNK